MFRINNLTVTAKGYKLLDGISFRIMPGQFACIIGQNGAGKSTLLKAVCGNQKTDSGTAHLGKVDLLSLPPEKSAAFRACLSQSFEPRLEFSVRELILMGRYPYFKKSPSTEDQQLVEELLDRLDLQRFADRPVASLSGGEIQRAHFARILAQLDFKQAQGKLLLLDEPLNNLDAKHQFAILDLAKEFADQGNYVLAVLHQLEHAYKYADHLLLLHYGQRIIEGSPNTIIHPNILNPLFGIKLSVNPTTRELFSEPLTPKNMNTSTVTIDPNNLKEQWQKLLEKEPKTRIRNAAKALNTSELALLGTELGKTAWLLDIEFQSLFEDYVTRMGKVTAITRNDDVVHERKGVYLNPQFNGSPVALFVGKDIDLRMFMRTWKAAFAVEEAGRNGMRRSVQIFAKDGMAVHKIYLEDTGDAKVFDELKAKHTAAEQVPYTTLDAPAPQKQEIPDSEIDLASFQKDWVELQDTHDFFMLLQRYKLSRTQALRLAPVGNEAETYPSKKYAVQLSNDTTRQLLNMASTSATPIMVFVGNPGMIQIHSGKVEKILDYGEWLNVMDPEFNLHIRENAIATTYLVRKPSEDGLIHSIEVFDAKGDLIVTFFGERKPGIPELESWRSLVIELENQASLQTAE